MPNFKDLYNMRDFKGQIEFIFKDRNGNILHRFIEPNVIKIFAKEIISHRLGHSRVWDPDADSGLGAWVTSTVDIDEDFSVKYIFFGASFDENGIPLGSNDTRFYTQDPATDEFIPNRLGVGADFDGGLINAIPIAEPDRPLKRVERIDFEPTYQPAGTPLLQSDVRAVNNIVIYETTIRPDEYNGFGLTDSDFFTITEVALAAGKELDAVGKCECTPRELFLEGDSSGTSLLASTTGGSTITLDSSAPVDLIKEGDQIMIVSPGGTSKDLDELDQVSPFYLVISKSATGRDMELDHVPVDNNNNPLTGDVGVFRDTLRIFSARILSVPVTKSKEFEIVVRWSIVFN